MPFCTRKTYYSYPCCCVKAWSLYNYLEHTSSRFWVPTGTGLEMKSYVSCTKASEFVVTVTLLRCPRRPTLLLWKAASACAATWAYSIPGAAGLCHFDRPVGCLWISDLPPAYHQPLLQPGILQGGLWLPLPSSHTSFQTFQKEKKIPPLLLVVSFWSLNDPIQGGSLQNEIRKYVWQRQILSHILVWPHWGSSEKWTEEENFQYSYVSSTHRQCKIPICLSGT